jgi:hypothetical protein
MTVDPWRTEPPAAQGAAIPREEIANSDIGPDRQLLSELTLQQ